MGFIAFIMWTVIVFFVGALWAAECGLSVTAKGSR